MSKTAQKNFRLEAELLDQFDQWCKTNGYDPTSVFKAAVLMFTEQNHEQRAAFFARLDSWANSGFRMTGPPQTQTGTTTNFTARPRRYSVSKQLHNQTDTQP